MDLDFGLPTVTRNWSITNWQKGKLIIVMLLEFRQEKSLMLVEEVPSLPVSDQLMHHYMHLQLQPFRNFKGWTPLSTSNILQLVDIGRGGQWNWQWRQDILYQGICRKIGKVRQKEFDNFLLFLSSELGNMRRNISNSIKVSLPYFAIYPGYHKCLLARTHQGEKFEWLHTWSLQQ